MSVSFVPSFWFARDAEAAARFYVSVIPGSSIRTVTSLPADSHSGPAGSVVVVEFTLAGAPVTAMAAGPHHDFNDAISLTLLCDTQEEIDALWDGLQQGGGKPVACGWLKDRYGVSWQITPRIMYEMMAHPDRARAAKAAAAMLTMVKFDIAALKAAFGA